MPSTSSRPARAGRPQRAARAPASAAEGDLSIRAAGAGDAGAALDAEAKADYRRRLEDLREDIEEAEGFNDPERAARAREEYEFISQELAGAVGLGGRDRPASSDAERARVNATRAIRKTLRARGGARRAPSAACWTARSAPERSAPTSRTPSGPMSEWTGRALWT